MKSLILTALVVAVANSCCCTLYEHCNYKGKATCVDKHTNWVGSKKNDKFSSIKVGKNCKCTIFQHSNYKGRKWTITGSTSEKSKSCFIRIVMQTITWNDQVSSVQVQKIPQDCKQTKWKCDVKCDKKTGTRTCRRKTTQTHLHHGRKCGALVEKRKCKVDCEVGKWGNYSKCTKPCGKGSKTRTRKVTVRRKNGGNACPALKQTVACNTQPCPINCQMHGWKPWSGCSKKCGGGTRTRTRDIRVHPKYGGRACPSRSKSVKCNTQPCLACPAGSRQWGGPNADVSGRGLIGHRYNLSITQCSTLCQNNNKCGSFHYFPPKGHPGIKTSVCIIYPVNAKLGPNYGILSVLCKPKINCQFGNYGAWSRCNKTCGGGLQSRSRGIKISPKNGGAACSKSGRTQTRKCNTKDCPLCHVYLFQHCSYKGYKHTYSSSKTKLWANDQYSSIKLDGNCRNYDVTLYQHHHYHGKSWRVTHNYSCFVHNRWNDIASSIKIVRKHSRLEETSQTTNTHVSTVVGFGAIAGVLLAFGVGTFVYRRQKYQNYEQILDEEEDITIEN